MIYVLRFHCKLLTYSVGFGEGYDISIEQLVCNLLTQLVTNARNP